MAKRVSINDLRQYLPTQHRNGSELNQIVAFAARRDVDGMEAFIAGNARVVAEIITYLLAFFISFFVDSTPTTSSGIARSKRGYSQNYEAVRKRAYRDKLKRDKVAIAGTSQPTEMSRQMSRDISKIPQKLPRDQAWDMPQGMSQHSLFVKRDLKNKQTNKLPAQPVPHVPTPRDARDDVQALLKSHVVFSGVATKTFAGTLLAEAPDVDLPIAIEAIARQIEATTAKPDNIAGYLRACMRRQQQLPPSQRVRPYQQFRTDASKTTQPPVFIPTNEKPAPTEDLISLFSMLGNVVSTAPAV